MNIVTSVQDMQQTAEDLRRLGKKIAVVPTMGYLHEGHLSLIRIAKQNADVVVTSIFVNPSQFGSEEDFSKYPRDLERDKRLAETGGAAILFVPTMEEMYPAHYQTYVEVEKITQALEGKFRPTHFRGVTTVVAKLFNIMKPHIAIFGQKDAQQAIIIKRMVKDLNFDVSIIVAPIVREIDGLAMSSRNVYLSNADREKSLILNRSLKLAKKLIADGERRCSVIIAEMMKLIASQPSVQVEYISIADPLTLEELALLHSGDGVLVSLAAKIRQTRLIDNDVIAIP